MLLITSAMVERMTLENNQSTKSIYRGEDVLGIGTAAGQDTVDLMADDLTQVDGVSDERVEGLGVGRKGGRDTSKRGAAALASRPVGGRSLFDVDIADQLGHIVESNDGGSGGRRRGGTSRGLGAKDTLEDELRREAARNAHAKAVHAGTVERHNALVATSLAVGALRRKRKKLILEGGIKKSKKTYQIAQHHTTTQRLASTRGRVGSASFGLLSSAVRMAAGGGPGGAAGGPRTTTTTSVVTMTSTLRD
jgi:hypothetical protein